MSSTEPTTCNTGPVWRCSTTQHTEAWHRGARDLRRVYVEGEPPVYVPQASLTLPVGSGAGERVSGAGMDRETQQRGSDGSPRGFIETLKRAMDAIRDQGGRSDEAVWFIDDPSPDPHPGGVCAASGQPSRVRTVRRRACASCGSTDWGALGWPPATWIGCKVCSKPVGPEDRYVTETEEVPWPDPEAVMSMPREEVHRELIMSGCDPETVARDILQRVRIGLGREKDVCADGGSQCVTGTRSEIVSGS